MKYLALTFLATSFVLSGACGGTIGGNPEKDGGGSTTEEPITGGNDQTKPAVRFDLTDAAVDGVQHVYITIAEVAVKAEGGSWTVLPLRQEEEFDLLALNSGKVTELAAIDELPAGTYTETRLVLSDSKPSRLIDADGEEHELKVPSGNSSGLKIKSDFTIAEGSNFHFTIDFDLRKSIKAVANGKRYQMKPVLRLVKNATTGSITGTVDNADTVCLYAAGISPDENDDCDNAESSAKVENGAFKAAFLPAGEYTLRFFQSGAISGSDAKVTVEAGAEAKYPEAP